MNGILAGSIPDQFNEVMTTLPALGAKSPDPWNLLVIDRTIEELWQSTDSTYKAQGVVVYQFPTQTSNLAPADDGLSVAVSSFTESVEITKNVGGARITVTDSDGVVRGQTITVPMSRARIGMQRKESAYPKARIDTYTNKLNASPWNGYAARTVRCEGISAETITNKTDWLVDYRFIYREEGWNAIEIVGIDIFTGKPIANPTGAQIALVDPYSTADFAALNITIA